MTDLDKSPELRAVHERMQVLEREIALRKAAAAIGPSSGDKRTRIVLITSVIVALIVMMGGCGYLMSLRPSSGVMTSSASRPPLPPLRPVVSEPQERPAPTYRSRVVTARINEDNEPDLVTLFRRADGLHELVAIDGLTLQPLWRRPLADLSVDRTTILKDVVGRDREALVLLGDRETIRSFSMSAGVPRGSWKHTSPIRDLCPLAPAAYTLIFVESSKKANPLLDLETGVLKAPEIPTARKTCEKELPLCDAAERVWPCIGTSKLTGSVLDEVHTSIENDEVIVNIGRPKVDASSEAGAMAAVRSTDAAADATSTTPRPRPSHGLIWNKASMSVVWEGPLALREDERHSDDVHVTLFDKSLVIAYNINASSYRLVFRDPAKGGTVTLNEPRNLIVNGVSWVEALTATDDVLYISFTDRIFVRHRDRTVRELRRIEAVP